MQETEKSIAMESINCAVCASSESRVLFSKKDKFGITNDDFRIVECENCGLIYINPRPTEKEIVKFYPETYSWKETLKTSSGFTRVIRGLEKKYRSQLLNYEADKVIKRTGLKTGKILDIGCGTGDRLNVYKSRGFEAYGVEVSSSARYAREYLNLEVVEGDLFKAGYPDNFFDIITMHNVLEHVHRTREIIGEAKRVLKKGGYMVIQVPNSDSLQFAIFRDRWTAVDPPRDLYYFNSRLLKAVLEKDDFRIEAIDHFSHWFHPPTLTLTLFPGLDPQLAWAKESSGLSSATQRVLWIFLTLTVSPFFTFFESLTKRSSIITFFASKK